MWGCEGSLFLHRILIILGDSYSGICYELLLRLQFLITGSGQILKFWFYWGKKAFIFYHFLKLLLQTFFCSEIWRTVTFSWMQFFLSRLKSVGTESGRKLWCMWSWGGEQEWCWSHVNVKVSVLMFLCLWCHCHFWALQQVLDAKNTVTQEARSPPLLHLHEHTYSK